MRRLAGLMTLAAAGMTVLMPGVACADTWTDTTTGYTWTYDIDEGEVWLEGDEALVDGAWDIVPAISPKPTGTLALPSRIDGKPVSGIGQWAFYGCTGLTGVTIPDSVIGIGGNTFENCGALQSVTIPAGVEWIGENAFTGCVRLDEIVFEGDAPEINEEFEDGHDYGSFAGVSSNCVVRVKQGTTGWGVTIPGTWHGMRIEYQGLSETVGGYTWSYEIKGGTAEVTGVSPATGSVTIPSRLGGKTVTSIGDYAFEDCDELTNVTIPNTVTNIGEAAFQYCGLSGELNLPSGLVGIGEDAFRKCDGLSSVVIPDSVRSIGEGAFYGCSGLSQITVGSANPFYQAVNGMLLTKDGKTLLQGINKGTVTIPDGVTSVGYGAFAHFDKVVGSEIPAGVTCIDDYAFYNCDALAHVRIAAGVTNIGDSAFGACEGLTNLTFEGNAPEVNEYAFDEVNSLCMVYVGKNSTGWGVTIPGTWNGMKIEYLEEVPIAPPTLSVTNVTARQRYPWNGLVDITCKVTGINGTTNGLNLAVAAVMPDSGNAHNVSHFWVEQGGTNSVDREIHANGNYRLLWDARADLGIVRYTNMVVRVTIDAHEKVQLWEGGPYWATTNIGAEKPEEYGYYFWWGDTVGYKLEGDAWVASDGSSSSFSFSEGNTLTSNKSISTLQSGGWIISQDGTYVLAPEHDAAQVLWGGGWRMPTYQELSDLNSKCDWTWTTMNGVNGYVVRGRGNYASNGIFLPCAGLGYWASLSYSGSGGYYWSSVPDSDSYGAWHLGYYSNLCDTDYSYRDLGESVRPVQGFNMAQGATLVRADDSAPFLLDTADGTRIAQEVETITYSPRWGNAANCTIDGMGGAQFTATAEGEISWTPAGAGAHTLTHTAGSLAYTAQFTVLGDDVAVHAGTLGTSETWGTNKTHLVTTAVTVPSGVSLTIEPGAVVKFMLGASLTVESGGACTAQGVIFTHVNDDSIGGDVLGDGAPTVAIPTGDYAITGSITDDDSTEYRYMPPQTLTSSISSNTRLRGHCTYIASNSVTVASGATLTLQPGTVIKFASGCSLTVNGTLDAQGTRASPIVFTSIKDDEFGGDTNGDGEETYPWAGDWARIYAGGTLNMNYCRIRYCNNNSDQGAIQGSGGTVLFDNGIIEASTYECVRMNSGKFTAHNSVFRDASMGFGYYGGSGVYVYNCVVADCTIACRASNKHFYNTVFYNCYTFLESTSSSCDHCVFYNEPGLGAQSATQVGSNGNIWGDPKFEDPDNADIGAAFRIAANSPCVNAGDAASAPEFDYLGQPRDDGTPDIGIYEIQSGLSANDLAAVAVSSTGGSPVQGEGNAQAARSTIGEKLTISYSVANVGKQVVNGSWRDKVSLVSADGGYSTDLGTVVQTAALAVGAQATFSASFTIPPEAEGTWRVQVGVNVERDIYEGKNVTNNVMVSAGTVEISLPARGAADGFRGTVTKGAPASAKFALSGTEPMVARINAPAGTVVYFGSGFMPSASSYSARAVVGADGGLIGIPAGVTSAYILVETTSSKGVAFTMTLESAALAVQSVTPTTLPYTGTTGLVIDGANFAEGGRVALCRDQTTVIETAATVVSSTRMTAQIDCSRLTAGATYDVKVVGPATGGSPSSATATLPNALTVANVPAAPKLKATLDAPASVRRGRTLTVYIDYENIGNADMPAPVFELISQGQVFKIDGACYTNSVKVMGLSSEAPVGTLRPGEPQRLGIPVTILAENVKWKLRSYHAAQASAKTKRFSLRELYDEDWVLYHVSDDDTTIANLRTGIGSTFADYYTSLGAWLGTVEPQTTDYEVLKSAFGRYQYLKASGMLDAGEEDSPAEGAENADSGRLSSAAASASVGRGVLTAPRTGCNHVLLANDWRLAGNGTIFKLCPECKQLHQLVVGYNAEGSQNWRDWYNVIESDAFDENRHTYVICHGNMNSVDEDWVRNMGLKILKRYRDASLPDPMILAVNWGEGANRSLWSGVIPPFAFRSAEVIPATSYEAARQLARINLVPDNTVLIGHSHGGHVAAHIACNYSKWGGSGKFKRLVGLDTSTTDNGIHDFWKKVKTVTGFNLIMPLPDSKWYGDWTPDKWISEVRNSCKQVEFYKSSWDMSLEKSTELFGHYNFVIAKKLDFYEHKVTGFLEEFSRHRYAHEWFAATIESPEKYADVGFNFDKDHSWKNLCKGKMVPVGGDKNFTGVIRDELVEMTYGCAIDKWRYAETVLDHEDWNSSKPMRQIANSMTRTVEYKVWPFLPSKLANGDNLIVRDINSADNQSIPYYLGGMMLTGGSGKSPLPWGNNIATCAWLIDLSGLMEQDATKEEMIDSLLARIGDASAINITQEQLLSIVGSSGKYIRRIGTARIGDPSVIPESSAIVFKEPGEPSDNSTISVHVKNKCFGNDRLIGAKDESGIFHQQRRILLLVGSGVEQTYFDSQDKMPKVYEWDADLSNNYALREVEVLPTEVNAVISTHKVEKAASLKSARLLSSASTHQLSANALKPGEVVQVKADKNGNWSIALDCTESYTTADEDEIVYNRFELTDAGNENGAPRFQNNNTICDVERVTVSGTLPQTTDADGNLVCEGKRYTVQLTVAAGDNEDDVTTCILDVRSATDEDPGEDEDTGGSNEPKSCDPNEMVGDEGVGEQRLVKPGQTLTYTIYFENKSDADAAAACVEVINPLNEWLDWSSLTMVDVGFNNHVDSGLDGKHEGESEKALDGTNTTVRTEFKVAYYDEEGNEVDEENALAARSTSGTGGSPVQGTVYAQAQWYLRIIDPDGDSEGWPLDMTGGFLPPNDDTHCGEGYIKYSIRVRDDAPANVVITNSATIIFDHFNDPIETDPAWWNTVSEPVPGTISVTTERTPAGGVMRMILHRTDGSNGRIAVKVKTQTSTGICGTDFAYVKEVLVWEDGDASDKVIEIPTYASGVGKSLRVKLATLTTGAYAGCVTPKLAESKVYADMTVPNPGTITVTAPDPLSVTAGETLRMTLSRTGGSDGKIAVKAKTQTSTALMGTNGSADFDYVKKTFEWADGDATDRYLDIPTYVQPWEGVRMLRVKLATLATGTYAGNLTPALAESKVYAEIESPVAFGTVYVAPETARPAAGETLRLVFRRTGGSDYPIAVKYKVQTSTAVAGTDFEYKKGVVTWGDGESGEQVVEVPTYPSAAGKQLRVKLSTLTQGAYEGCVTPHLNSAKVYVPLR